jgi:hypothetical protein
MREGVVKQFYLQEGMIVFVSSNQAGERFGEYLQSRGALDRDRLMALLEESRRRGVKFTANLLAFGVFNRPVLEDALHELVILALKDAFTWMDGEAVWEDGLPLEILQGPVRIEVHAAAQTVLGLTGETGIGAGPSSRALGILP